MALEVEGLLGALAAPARHRAQGRRRSPSAQGEVLGIGGVAGNGQDELLLALSGEMRTRARHASASTGEPIGHLRPDARRARGLLCAPEERNGHASAPDMSLTENAFLTGRVREGLARGGFVDWAGARAFAERIIKGFDVRTPGPGAAARSLSGGNLQKFVIGREILQRPDVLVVNQPTWGVDASAAAAIRQALLDLATPRRGGGRGQPGPRRADGDRRPLRRAERGRASRRPARRGASRSRRSA